MKYLISLPFLWVFSLAGYAQNHNQPHQALEIEIQLNHSSLEYYKGPGGEIDLPYNEYDQGALAIGCRADYVRYYNRWFVLTAGLGFSQHNYEEQTINGWTGEAIKSTDVQTHFIDLTLGHEFNLIERSQWNLFLGNALIGQFNLNNKKFDDFGLSVQSELGVRKKIIECLYIHAELSYQRWLTTYGDINSGYYDFQPEWLGGALGLRVIL